MIERIADRITSAQSRAPWTFILVFAIVTALLLPGALRLVDNVEPSLEKVLPQTIDEVKAMNDMRGQFGADMVYLVMEAEGPATDVRSPAILRYQDLVAEKLRGRERILEVTSLADLAREANGGELPEGPVEARRILTEHPLAFQYASADWKVSIVQIRSDTGASASLITETIDAIKTDLASLEPENPGVSVQVTGFNAIDKATFEVIISDFMRITILSMILIMIIVLVTFRGAKAFLPLLVVMVALLWTMGIAGYAGLTITVVSMVSAAMILGLGIDFGIHILHTYDERRKRLQRKSALRETMRELLRAMLGASLTTMAGFLALLAGVLPAMKTLGVILALGILTTMLGATLLLPPVLYLSDGAKPRRRTR